MRQLAWRACGVVLVACCLSTVARAQSRSYTWPQLRDKFETANPTLLASQINIAESKAGEVTANLRPNPDLTVAVDHSSRLPSIPTVR